VAPGAIARLAVALVAAAEIVAGCGPAPAANGPGAGAGGAGAGGGAPTSHPSATPASTAAYPDRFSGTIAGDNGVDTWRGTATLDRLPVADECNQDGAVVCYGISGGSVVWTVAGVSQTMQLGPATAADGLVLIVADTSNPSHNGSYEISVTPTTDVFTTVAGSPRYAFETVRDWVDVLDYPRIDPGWHLAGQYKESGCGIDGCGPDHLWTWDLQGTFGP
jgi:hypothetical protein